MFHIRLTRCNLFTIKEMNDLTGFGNSTIRIEFAVGLR